MRPERTNECGRGLAFCALERSHGAAEPGPRGSAGIQTPVPRTPHQCRNLDTSTGTPAELLSNLIKASGGGLQPGKAPSSCPLPSSSSESAGQSGSPWGPPSHKPTALPASGARPPIPADSPGPTPNASCPRKSVLQVFVLWGLAGSASPSSCPPEAHSCLLGGRWGRRAFMQMGNSSFHVVGVGSSVDRGPESRSGELTAPPMP